MAYSKKAVEELVAAMIYSGRGWRMGSRLEHEPEYYAHWCEECIGWKGLVVDINGTRAAGDDMGPIDYAHIDRDSVASVKDFFVALYGLRPFTRSQLLSSRHCAGSYHLKHVMEKLRKIAGDGIGIDEHGFPRDGYVSNGEFIIGYTLFLADFLLFDGKAIRKMFRRSETGPNVFCRLPATFTAIERYLHDRRAI